MLRKFEVKNFKNFNDWFVFDLSDTKSYAFNPECVENGIATKALVYGPNGCGKTNLGLAIFDIKTHLTDEKIDGIIYSNNYLNAASGADIAEFKYTFQFGENILEYSYGKEAVDKLVYETVTINEKMVISFDRRESTTASINLAGAETLNREFGDNNLSMVKYVRNNTILADNPTNETIKKFFLLINFMELIRTINSHNKVSVNSETVSELILKKTNGLKHFESFLNEAGVSCKLTTIKVAGNKIIAFDYANKTIEFCSVASTGTLSLTDLYLNLIILRLTIEVCQSDSDILPFIFIDEFDAFYHHAVSKLIVKQLRNDRCQAILSTHNTSIMTNDLLRPDCYFFMSETDIKPMYRLTDTDLRKAHNIEKMYKAGAFDG